MKNEIEEDDEEEDEDQEKEEKEGESVSLRTRRKRKRGRPRTRRRKNGEKKWRSRRRWPLTKKERKKKLNPHGRSRKPDFGGRKSEDITAKNEIKKRIGVVPSCGLFFVLVRSLSLQFIPLFLLLSFLF